MDYVADAFGIRPLWSKGGQETGTFIADGPMGVRVELKPGTFFVQEGVGGHDERPEAQDGGGVHKLVLVEAEQVFGITE